MIVDKNSIEDIIHDGTERIDKSSSLFFPYSFIFRTQDQLNEHISKKFRNDRIVQYPKCLSGLIGLILPLFNVFTIYRNLIYQRKGFADTYSIFHSIIFYGEFIELHIIIFIFLIIFIYHTLKLHNSSKGRWIYFFNYLFILMTFDMFKLIPIISTNGFSLFWLEINLITPIIKKFSKISQIIIFPIFICIICIEILLLLCLLILIILVKVYQLSFVGEVSNPSQWTINQWFLFIGFSSNIINLSDIPTISQISFMWHIINQNWSSQLNMWKQDQLGEARKIYLFTQICQTFGFVKGFLWIRSMSAGDLHSLIRLPSSNEQSCEHV